MGKPAETTVDYERLSGIAYGTVFHLVSTSARENVADQIAADTIEQYLVAVADGEEVRNPYAWVKVRAGWRAIDEMRRWQRHKVSTRPFEPFEPDNPDDRRFAELLHWMGSGELGSGPWNDPERIVVAEEWVRALIDTAYPDDSTNRRLAIACLVEGAKPREVADEFGMDARVIGNRLVRIRAKLLDTLPVDERR